MCTHKTSTHWYYVYMHLMDSCYGENFSVFVGANENSRYNPKCITICLSIGRLGVIMSYFIVYNMTQPHTDCAHIPSIGVFNTKMPAWHLL